MKTLLKYLAMSTRFSYEVDLLFGVMCSACSQQSIYADKASMIQLSRPYLASRKDMAPEGPEGEGGGVGVVLDSSSLGGGSVGEAVGMRSTILPLPPRLRLPAEVRMMSPLSLPPPLLPLMVAPPGGWSSQNVVNAAKML